MLLGNKNLKDVKTNSIKDDFPDSSLSDKPIQELSMSYTKTNKLITALYMVTDVIDSEEPIRNKLRTLGAGIISDIHSTPAEACGKIYEIMSFLEIAFAINIISEMNCNILRKEFLELNQALKKSTDKIETINRQINLSQFFKREESEDLIDKKSNNIENFHSIGHPIRHQNSTRIGVQKGSTLMKALSDKTHLFFNMNMVSDKSKSKNDFDISKRDRRNNINKIIKLIGGSATIKDIKDRVQINPEQAGTLVSCSEKTLQRELMSMIKDGVLKKTGEKRWSRYFLAPN